FPPCSAGMRSCRAIAAIAKKTCARTQTCPADELPRYRSSRTGIRRRALFSRSRNRRQQAQLPSVSFVPWRRQTQASPVGSEQRLFAFAFRLWRRAKLAPPIYSSCSPQLPRDHKTCCNVRGLFGDRSARVKLNGSKEQLKTLESLQIKTIPNRRLRFIPIL